MLYLVGLVLLRLVGVDLYSGVYWFLFDVVASLGAMLLRLLTVCVFTIDVCLVFVAIGLGWLCLLIVWFGSLRVDCL